MTWSVGSNDPGIITGWRVTLSDGQTTDVPAGVFTASFSTDLVLGTSYRARVGPEVTGLPGGGSSQTFEHGAIFFSAVTGAFAVRGAILVHYLALDGPAGPLG